MSFTRRGVLAAAALAQSSLLGGCFGGDGGDGTRADGGSSDGGSSSTGTPEPTTTGPTATATGTPTGTPTPVANAGVATATANVVSQFEWFRTEYKGAITRFRVEVGRVYTVLTRIQDVENRTRSDVESLRAATTDLAEFVQATLVPHFVVDPALRTGNNVYVRDFERGVARGDREFQNTALSRAMSFYGRVTKNEYVSNELSRRPVYGPLYDILVPSGATDRIVALVGGDGFTTWAHPDLDESTARDGIDRHTHEFPSGYRVFTHAHENPTIHPIRDHTNEPELNELYAYGDGGVGILIDEASYRERLDDFAPALTGLFGPVKSDGRTAGVTLVIGTAGAGWGSSPVYVEAFDTVDAARAATAGDDVGSEGVTPLAGRDWERIFYDAAGTTIYAYRLRAGSTVLTALPSDVPWERRPEWAAGLAGTWLAAE